jgi:hypothetical protein
MIEDTTTDHVFEFVVEQISDRRDGCTVLLAMQFKSRAEAGKFKTGLPVMVHVE